MKENMSDVRKFRGKIIIPEYCGLFGRIEAKKEELQRRRSFTEGETKRLKEEFCIDYIYHSNALEDNSFNLQETALVLDGMPLEHKSLKEYKEVVGQKEAFYYVEKLVKKQEEMTEKVIKDIHSLVLVESKEDQGMYRNIPIHILGKAYEPPQPIMIPMLMEKLVSEQKLRNRKLHSIEAAARFHLDFEGIHPFVDGNGRTGRLLLNLELMKYGFYPISIKKADKKKYYDCFTAYFKEENADMMIRFLAGYVEEELDRYLAILE